VLGHCRPADRQVLGQLTGRARVPGQSLEDRAPGRVAEQTQSRISIGFHSAVGPD
jgi:hypothetical protein